VIFVTVGTQLPFPRLLNLTLGTLIDTGYTGRIVLQTADKDYQPNVTLPGENTFKAEPFIKPDDFDRYVDQADLVVSHAGMGNLLSCLEQGKPGLFLGRSCSLGEHRNNHQMDTVNSFKGKFSNIYLCMEEQEFVSILTKRKDGPSETDVEIDQVQHLDPEMERCKQKLLEFLR
jgi:UDP-N-acetylglucosamine transferase subunit ALG13